METGQIENPAVNTPAVTTPCGVNTPAVIVPMNRKTKYYYAHRDEPEFKARLKLAQRKYYVANRAVMIENVKKRFNAKKEAAQGRLPVVL